VPNAEAFRALRYKVADLDNVQLQVCQPPALDCPQRRFLDEHGEGVFHLGFESDLDTAARQGAELGLDVLMQGRRPNGSGFVYFDTLEAAGVVLLARQTTR
jgi:methylmalonyl-CoA/ethylmalonyl-CoA epimerase